MSFRTEISKLLKEDFNFRKKKGFYRIKNQLQLAKVWGVCENTVQNKLSGRSPITREELEIYAYNFYEDSDWVSDLQEEAMKRAKEEK